MSVSQQIVNINEYKLAASADDYVAAISSLAARTESDGEPGVLRYQFYVDRASNTATAVIHYSDADAWVNHHRLAYQWPEMAALQATVELQRITFLGPTSDDIDAMASGITADVVRGDELAAGFIR